MTTVVLDPAAVNDLLVLHPASVALASQPAHLGLDVLVGLIVVAFGLFAALRVMFAMVAQLLRPTLRLIRLFVVTVLSVILLAAMLLTRPAGAARPAGPVPTPRPTVTTSPTATIGHSVAAPSRAGPVRHGPTGTSAEPNDPD
jgi:hypothetical protein